MREEQKNFRSGFVAIIGRSNAGKSTLLNRLTGEKIAIVSPKPQTTRNKIAGILTTPAYQIVFEDTPGIYRGKGGLFQYMKRSWEAAAEDTDAIVFVIDGTKPLRASEFALLASLEGKGAPVIAAVNKTDTARKEDIFPVLARLNELKFLSEVIPLSAKKGENCDLLLEKLVSLLPEGCAFYPEDEITDKSERFIAAEVIREKILLNLDEEVPHGVGINVVKYSFDEGRGILDIDAEIYCERDNHKAILIGKEGSMLKKIGASARFELEKNLGQKVFLNLFVKVRRDWRDNDNYLRDLGYNRKEV